MPALLGIIRAVYDPFVYFLIATLVGFLFYKTFKQIRGLFKTNNSTIKRIILSSFYLVSTLAVSIILGLIIFITFEFFLRIVVFKCKEEEKVFVYDGCSANYTLFFKDGSCIAGGIGMSPDIEMPAGFDKNKRIDVLKCLCDANKLDSASKFRREYFEDDDVVFTNACENLPREFQYF